MFFSSLSLTVCGKGKVCVDVGEGATICSHVVCVYSSDFTQQCCLADSVKEKVPFLLQQMGLMDVHVYVYVFSKSVCDGTMERTPMR